MQKKILDLLQKLKALPKDRQKVVLEMGIKKAKLMKQKIAKPMSEPK